MARAESAGHVLDAGLTSGFEDARRVPHVGSAERGAPARAESRRGAGALLMRAGLLLAIAALPVTFNAWIDPARIVTAPKAEEEIARALASGRNVTEFTNYDDRAIERALAPLRPTRAQVLVLGSSRMQALEASAFPGATFANAAMQGGTLDDMLAVYALYDTDGRRPARVVLGVDPWTESYRETSGWRRLASEREALMRRIGVPVSPWRERASTATAAMKRLASPEYFRLSVFSFRHHGTSGIGWKATTETLNPVKTKLPTGTVVWPPSEPSDVNLTAARYAKYDLAADARFQHLDAREPGREDVLERFVRYLRSEGVEVTLLLAPYPPEVYDAFARLPGRSVYDVEARVRAMAARSGARVQGGYDPRPQGVTTRDFFDESHLRPDALARVVAR